MAEKRGSMPNGLMDAVDGSGSGFRSTLMGTAPIKRAVFGQAPPLVAFVAVSPRAYTGIHVIGRDGLPQTMSLTTSVVPVREISLVALLAVAGYVLLAIGSYSPQDPAWTFAGSDLAVSNLMGSSGAFAADIMLLAFGWQAYLLPAGLVALAIALLRSSLRTAWSWPLALIRSSGFVAVLIAGCVLARLHFPTAAELPVSPGGAVGASIAEACLPMLNWAGLTLCMVAVLAIGAQAMLGYSWLGLVENIGRGIHVFASGALAIAIRLAGLLGRAAVGVAKPLASSFQARAVAAGPEPAPVPEPARIESSVAPAAVAGSVPAVRPSEAKEPAEPVSTGVQGASADPKTMAELPDLDLLEEREIEIGGGFSNESLEAMSRLLEDKLADFRVEAKAVSVLRGPVVTRFELQPAAGVKVSKIAGLAKDLARSLAVVSVRIVEIIPGKSVVGIEIPNAQREMVRLKELLSSAEYRNAESPLTLALGKDIAGVPMMADVGRMPHLLIAGTTGSGKSVGVNAMLLSMLYKATPDDLRLILVDPKMLELSIYDGIPHLLTPVVTDMKDAAQALNWCVAEMERRYQMMAALGVRNLAGYNRRIAEARDGDMPLPDPLWPADAGEPAPPLPHLPFIVVVIDEFADMMMIVGKKVEQLIARIAQKARAAGIHLVLATQRPSVDVITGLIKANIPARIGFQVSSRIDSRTILDQGGAEQLLGHGDMLFLPPGTSMPVRVHGAFVSDDEVHAVAADWKERGDPDYVADVLAGAGDANVPGTVDITGDAESDEPLYDEAVAFVLESRRASISSVQRKLRVGYNRAARLIEAMEQAGLVSPMDSNGSRQILVPDRSTE